MRPNRILHPELARALATLGHTDIVLVTDAGFPIPAGANRIDLGFYEGLPDICDILRVLRQEIFVEEVHFATEVRDRNPDLYANLQEIYTGAGAVFKGTTHEELCADYAKRAKVIIRSGSFNPWANIALIASTDPFAWFSPESNTKVLPAYEERRRLMTEKVVPALA
ncbi:D-ribose pyranase [Consotaella salsifontis]|uniref:D-ribose pyranase n=1 Tax=Consotaella salsifontis TaxID=1365950 RepID=A0A1T4S7A7_9HYPH|nr:D-ribose pyranase [Consotaella salsifontis]SKA24149.1 simple sugar transport system permease protein/D-ribose pyranase [Consotaella salsifontis]